MKATVYFLKLPDVDSWASPEGEAYLKLKYGKTPLSLATSPWFEEAAVLEARDGEEAWLKLQNLTMAWPMLEDVKAVTDRPRSMDVGDYIVWENGRVERCASVGFEEIEA